MYLRKIMFFAVISAILFTACPLEEGISAITCEAEELPAIKDVKVTSKNTVLINFTTQISDIEVVSEPDLGVPEINKNGTAIEIVFPQDTEVGAKYIISGTAKSGKISSLDFELNLLGFNNRIPKLFINEVRTDYSKPKTEFIELRALSNGNLSGITLEIASAEESGIYVFPPVEVDEGDFITLHLRKMETAPGETIEDDLETKTSGYCGTDTNENAWDFWVETNTKLLRKSDVITLFESKDGKITDGLIISEGNLPQWKTELLANKALKLVQAGIWAPDEKIGNGAFTTDINGKNLTTTTRTLGLKPGSENNFPRTKAMWQICDTGEASPGSENSDNIYGD